MKDIALLASVVGGGIVVVILSVGRHVSNRRLWWKTAVLLSVLSALASSIVGLWTHFEGRSNLLGRDVVALVIIATASPLVAAFAARWFDATADHAYARVLGSFVVVLLLSVAAVYVQLLVHCSSGDCL
jgi:hypothetical protein